MVLVVGSSVVIRKPPSDLRRFLDGSSRLKEDAGSFKDKEEKVLTESEGLLYVNQHEYAVTYPGDPNVTFLGSEDATTCHVLILRHPVSGVTALAHFDDVGESGRNIAKIADCLFRTSAAGKGTTDDEGEAAAAGGSSSSSSSSARTLEVSLVGGFEDEAGKSEELSLAIFRDLVMSDVNFILGLCCIGHLNTIVKSQDNVPFPEVYGCAVDLQSGEIFRARFPDSHGPENILRHVRCSFNKDPSSSDLYSLYDCRTGTFEIQPFRFQYFPWLHLWCQASTKDILENMSTSPKVEPKYFVPTLKAAMKFIIDHPKPMETVFKGEKSIIYRRSNGKWILQEESTDETD